MQKNEHRPIVLLTDFGRQDAFVGVMKGVIALISPKSTVIDLSHDVGPQDIGQAAFLLVTACSYFPDKTIFCVVVDPGVGSHRRGICIETRDYFFVGPDNGVLWEAAKDHGIKRIIHLTNPDFFLDRVSTTFHGRDVFAPVAAHISGGLNDAGILGNSVKKCVEYHLPRVEKKTSSLGLTVVYIDRFGNITLNLREKEFRQFVQDRPFVLTLNGVRIHAFYHHYSQAKDGQAFLIRASSSFLEISVKNSNAAECLNARCMDKAVLERFDDGSGPWKSALHS